MELKDAVVLLKKVKEEKDGIYTLEEIDERLEEVEGEISSLEDQISELEDEQYDLQKRHAALMQLPDPNENTYKEAKALVDEEWAKLKHIEEIIDDGVVKNVDKLKEELKVGLEMLEGL
jgi:predicted nuclease with TOPRIM domain